MNGRVTVILIAIALAAGVFILSLLAGSGTSEDDAEGSRADQTVDTPDAEVAPGFDTTTAIAGDLRREDFVEDAEEGFYRYEDGNRITHLYFDRVTPAGEGVLEVDGPSARIFIDEQTDSVVVIAADEGTFIAPENQLQEGAFRGHVTVTVFEGHDGRPPDINGTDDIEVRVYLDDADFDMELGQLESPGPVHLTGPRVDFVGKGLSIAFNELRNRIEKLEVYEGDLLRFKPGQLDDASDTTPQARAGSRPAEPAPEAPESTEPRGVPAPSESRPPQYYRARFGEDVHILAEQGKVTMDADVLEAIFVLGRQRVPRPAAVGRADDRHRPVSQPLPSIAQLVSLTIAQTPQPAGRSLFPAGPEDVTVTWRGRLTIVPEPAPPADMSGDDDVLLRLVGSPVKIRDDQGQAIDAGEVSYLASTKRIGAAASAEQPMVVTAPKLGTLRGRALAIEQATGIGYVLGPGSLEAELTEGDDNGDAAVPWTIAWSNRLDLAFFLTERDRDDSAADDPFAQSPIGALKRADFQGDVEARHPELEMVGQQIAIVFALADDGRSQPMHVHAEREVRAENDDMLLTGGRLDVELKPSADQQPQATDDDATEPPPMQVAQDLSIAKIEAEDAVRVTLKQDDVRLSGDRLIADVDADQLEVFGDATSHAAISRGGSAAGSAQAGSLNGRHIVMERATQTVHVIGSGSFDAQIDPDQPDHILTVAWQEAMHYDDVSGIATFTGGIEAQTSPTPDVNTLTCNDMQVDFIKLDGDAPPEADDEAFGGDRRIRTVACNGDAVFEATGFDPADGNVMTRLHIEGPVITFDNTPGSEKAQVAGKGQMLFEDYRPSEKRADETGQAVAISGRGATLFLWEKQLTLDAAVNDMTMEQDVQMIHHPAGSEDMAQLDCQHLVADLEERGGLGGWFEDEATRPAVIAVRGRDAVRVKQHQRELIADNFDYIEAKRRVVFTAAPGNDVVLRDLAESTEQHAESFAWYLDRDAFDVIRPRGNVIPIRE